MSFITVYVTHASEDAAKSFTDILIGRKAIACANLFPIQSAYWWQGEICQEEEWVSLLKTQNSHWEALKSLILEIHPYDTPCIMKTQVEANEQYEQWIVEMTKEFK